MAQYKRVLSATPEEAETLRFNDAELFGVADENREQQIEKGVEYYKMERERQRGVFARIAQHKIIDIDNHSSG